MEIRQEGKYMIHDKNANISIRNFKNKTCLTWLITLSL